MATVELPYTREDIGEREDEQEHDDHKFCHLYEDYLFATDDTTVCGIPEGQDWHSKAHAPSNVWEKGQMSCPDCGVPICMDCLLKCS